MVLVRDTAISSDGGRAVAHSLQNLESAGLSVWHFGHFTFTVFPSQLAKAYQLGGKESTQRESLENQAVHESSDTLDNVIL
jgi:hypothetical protein